jgi:dihydroxyacetone kinase DhaKLM complex PTS-EIIA-like component DhaM
MNSLNDVSLNYFTGTDKYYRHRIGTSQFLLTEGCKYVAEQGKAYWLFDIILSYQNHDKIKTQEFQYGH